MSRIPAVSREAIRVPAIEAIGTDVATLISYAVAVAVTAKDVAPAAPDWKTATWSADGEPDHPAAKLVIGPGSASGVALTAGTTYSVWARVTGGSEIAVVDAGHLTAF